MLNLDFDPEMPLSLEKFFSGAVFIFLVLGSGAAFYYQQLVLFLPSLFLVFYWHWIRKRHLLPGAPQRIISLRFDGEGWQLEKYDAPGRKGISLQSFYLGQNMLVLNFKKKERPSAYPFFGDSILVLPEQLGEKGFRQLRLFLKYSP